MVCVTIQVSAKYRININENNELVHQIKFIQTLLPNLDDEQAASPFLNAQPV